MESEEQNQHLENIAEIRSLMERSSLFVSLSGLSGIFIGLFALIGVAIVFIHMHISPLDRNLYTAAFNEDNTPNFGFYRFVLIDAFLVLTASLIVSGILTQQKAKKNALPIWDSSARRLMINMLIPLVTGGIFCIILLFFYNVMALVAPITLIFYGLALINASKYTLHDIRSLGIAEVCLGLLASIHVDFGLLYWAAGFGVLHIIYGTVMYYKYER